MAFMEVEVESELAGASSIDRVNFVGSGAHVMVVENAFAFMTHASTN